MLTRVYPFLGYTLIFDSFDMSLLRLFLVCISFLAIVSSNAQGRYSYRLMDEGTMIFFYPCKLVPSGKESSLVYDMNYITGRDSVTINMTYTASQSDVKSVRLKTESIEYETTNVEVFYREKKKKNIATRLHIICPKEVYEKLFHSESPLSVEVITTHDEVSRFSYKPSKWRKEKASVQEAILLAK